MGSRSENRLTPILNLIMNDNQCAYKTERANTNAISYTKGNLPNTEILGHIPVDLSKAFGRINRTKLGWILYEEGRPMKLTKQMYRGNNGNIIQGKNEGT